MKEEKAEEEDPDHFPSKEYKLDMLKKFKDMAGEKKQINQYYSVSVSPANKESSPNKKKNQPNIYLEKVKKLKTKVQ